MRMGSSTDDSDAALAQKARSGDAQALRLIYERHTRAIFAFIANHLEDSPQEVEDVWQETWLAAVRSLVAFRGESRFFTWLCSIARHKIADHFRRAGRMESPISLDGHEHLPGQLDAEPIPEEALADKAIRLQVIETLMALPIDYRDALMLRYADELSVPEVASKIKRNYKSTESLLSRARKAFQTEFTRRTTDEKKDE